MSTVPTSSAGTLESNDIYIVLSQSGPGTENTVSLESTVIKHFGPAILAVIRSSLEQAGVTGVHIQATDKGALDWTIRARMETAILRYKELAA